ncbi:squalene epoxidase 3-like isoform X2 [Actinidia eriantha]|uniref:squalene epoxidase 3-like isoform X2 n=1 Tax=Actinidia eriantha TaxID=165200 RepID=UPI002584539E|nr:squalene epoxidase 3-like isoform X2 [Actinidia eriantha]
MRQSFYSFYASHHPIPGHPPRPGPRLRTNCCPGVFAYKRPPPLPLPLPLPLSLFVLQHTATPLPIRERKRRGRTKICCRGLERASEGDSNHSSGSSCCHWLTNPKKMTIMVDDFILGTFLASLLGFVFLYILRRSATTKADKRRRAVGAFNDEIRNDCVRSSENEEVRPEMDVIVVGAGVAGAALAHTLGKDGRRVHVIERDLTEPDRIVGELLQPGGYLKLIELGLKDCVEEIDAQRVLGYALFKDGRNARLSYPLEKFHSDVSGRSFHNGRFIQRMREKAATLPNVRLEQGTVTSLLEENRTIKGVQYKTKTGQELKAYAPLTIVCDGCFSNLRRSLCKPKVDVPSCFIGLVLENCKLPFPNHGHVILADPSPILFYPISSTEIRCLVDVPGQKLPPIANGEMANYLKTLVAPQPMASTINTLAGALYKVFRASPDQARKEMREACFGYLSLGGVCSTGPVALLSGLNPCPLSLVLHFFAVAIYGVGRLLLPFPSPKRLWIATRLIWCASGIIFPIIKAEGVRQTFFPATVPAYYRAPPVQ